MSKEQKEIKKVIEIIKVITYNDESTEFSIKFGLKQGCVLSSLLFHIILDDAIKKCRNMEVAN